MSNVKGERVCVSQKEKTRKEKGNIGEKTPRKKKKDRRAV